MRGKNKISGLLCGRHGLSVCSGFPASASTTIGGTQFEPEHGQCHGSRFDKKFGKRDFAKVRNVKNVPIDLEAAELPQARVDLDLVYERAKGYTILNSRSFVGPTVVFEIILQFRKCFRIKKQIVAKDHFYFMAAKAEILKMAAQSDDMPFLAGGVSCVLSREPGNDFVDRQKFQQAQSFENRGGARRNNGVFLPASGDVSFPQFEGDEPWDIEVLDA